MGLVETYLGIAVIASVMGLVIMAVSSLGYYVFRRNSMWHRDHVTDMEVGAAFVLSAPVWPLSLVYAFYRIHRDAAYEFRAALRARLNR